MTVIQELEWTSLTPLVNEVKPVQSFLKQLLFRDHQTQTTDLLEIGTLVGDRSMAPFVHKDGEGIMVEGLTQTAISLRPPQIRIKKPFTPTPLLFERSYGDVIHLQPGDSQVSAVQRHIARDSQRMVDLVANSEEYLSSMALTGTVAYTNEQDGASFSVAFAKSSENTVVLTGTDVWTNAASVPKIDILRAKRRLADAVGLQPTDAIMGLAAAEAFLDNADVIASLDTRRLVSGTVDITGDFSDQGVIFLGTYGGVRWWEYSRQINVPGLGLTSLVDTNTVHFVTSSPAAEQVLYYGAIRDMRAFQGNVLESERFSKAWEEEDPSVLMQLIESHPLPTLRRPDSIYSLQVI